MAYDRHDTRDGPRDERSRWQGQRPGDRDFERDRNDRGFFERAGDEIASWFGDEDAERRRREDEMREERENRWSGSRDHARSRQTFASDRGPDRERERGWGEPYRPAGRGGFSEGDYNRGWRRELSGNRERAPRPMTGDYGRGGPESEQFFAASGYGRGERALGQSERDQGRSQSPWDRDEYRRTSRAGTADASDRSRHEDPHYESWRQRHLDELDRDYDDYRRENQSRFESDFGSWRERRTQKRGLLGRIREHMDVVGNDDEHVGTVDRVAGDRIILTRSDPESGGVHHSLTCGDIDRVEDDRVILDCSSGEAKRRWRDESSGRALFEREDQGEMGPRSLNRSFEGTYR
jgi:hypothetical protein